MTSIRILVVDDSVVIRKLLTETLSGDIGLEVVGAASDGRIALTKISQLKPDLVTLDIEMPVMNGLEALAEMRVDIPVNVKEITQYQLYAFADHAWLHNIASVVGTPQNVDAASVGGGIRLGWQSYLTTDLSLAKAVEGPRDDTRFFFIVTGRY